jgi:two-component system, NtrC family, C4-dicarboxylate transport response regulator DctD
MTAAQQSRPEGRNLRVFIVEDDPHLSAHLTDVLRLEGCAVVTAVDGLHALQFLTEGFRPDVILLDMHMDGADGWDFFTAVRQLELDVPIVVMTGDPNAAQCAADVGAASYLKKPFETEQLLGVVDAVVKSA